LLQRDEDYESDNNKVKYGLKEDYSADGESSRRFGCSELWLWCPGQIDEQTRMGSYARAQQRRLSMDTLADGTVSARLTVKAVADNKFSNWK
jgi:hypothetical protein